MVKGLWGTASLASTILCAYLINFSVRKWLDHPYITYVESVPIREVDFPAVTICPDAWNM